MPSRPHYSGNYILQLQRTAGNRAVRRLLGSLTERDLPRSNSKSIRRKIDFTESQPTLADPIPLALGGSILGSTLPGFNGTVLPKNAIKKDYKEAVFKVLQPLTYNFSTAQKGMTCKVDPDKYNIGVFAHVRAITKPKKDKWSGTYASAVLRNPPAACAKTSSKTIDVEMKGKPDSAALCRKVLAHEREHVTDLKTLMAKELKPYHDFLMGLTGTGQSEKDCVTDLFRQVGNRDALAAQAFVNKWLDAVQVYDKAGGTHHSNFTTTVDAACTKLKITETT